MMSSGNLEFAVVQGVSVETGGLGVGGEGGSFFRAAALTFDLYPLDPPYQTSIDP